MSTPTPELPPLPEPFVYPEGLIVGPCACGSWPGGKCLRCTPINFYIAEQLQDYARAALSNSTKD